MTIQSPTDSYQQNSVNTASRGDLTLMLYNGCLKNLLLARRSIEEKNMVDKNQYLQKAEGIIEELVITLEPENELSKSILPLYEFIYQRLLDANIKNDLLALQEAEELVRNFRDTWKEVLRIHAGK